MDKVFYFKFLTRDGEELYGKIDVPRAAIDMEKFKRMLDTDEVIEVDRQEYEIETDEVID